MAPRGLIYDRDGNLLVENRPSYKIIIDMAEFPPTQEFEKAEIRKVANIVKEDFAELWEGYKEKALCRWQSDRTATSDAFESSLSGTRYWGFMPR